MQTSLLNTGQSSSASPSSVVSGITDSPSDLFTKLLVAQIKNQDPLEPSDPSQFVNQLTQLSQMESMQKLAAQSSGNASILQSMQIMALGSQVGSQVTVQSDKVVLADQPVQGSFSLASGSSAAALVLTGADGTEHRLELGTRAAGEVAFSIDPTALGLAQGSYGLRVDAANSETPPVGILGDLSSVKLSSAGNAVLNVANVGEVLPAAITQFNGRPTTSTK